MTKRTLFLLGAGASVDAGMPSVDELTEAVRDTTGVRFHTACVFRRGLPDSESRVEVDRVAALLDDLRELHRRQWECDPDYEQLASLVTQLDDALSQEYETALALPVAEELGAKDYAQPNLGKLCALARAYIADMVHQELEKPPATVGHLHAIVDACRKLDSVHLATLNHDMVLERALEAAGVAVADGFSAGEAGVRPWADEWSSAAISLMKLHGSIDWWGYTYASAPWRRWITSQVDRRTDAFHAKHPDVRGTPFDMRPIFLTGTFDKILRYEGWVFPDQHARFHECLYGAQTVISVGYGFRDKAVNSRVIGWMARGLDNRLVVCDPKPEELRAHVRQAIENYWDEWTSDGRMVVIGRGVNDVSFADLEPHVHR